MLWVLFVDCTVVERKEQNLSRMDFNTNEFQRWTLEVGCSGNRSRHGLASVIGEGQETSCLWLHSQRKVKAAEHEQYRVSTMKTIREVRNG